MLRFVIHTQYFPPEIGAPQARLSELARYLSTHGFEVEILTAMPNYPVGKIFPGYSGFFREETWEGIKVYRSAIYPTKSVGIVGRLINYFSFVISSGVIGSIVLRRSEIVLTESPPLFLGLAGFVLSRLKRARWIFNISDLWPESAVELGVIDRKGFSYRLAAKLEAFLYRKAWLVTGQSKTILANIRERYKDFPTLLLSNGVDTTVFKPIVRTNPEEKLGDELIFLYAGLHGIAQGLEQVVVLADNLRLHAGVKFLFVGDGPDKDKLIKLTRDLRLENIEFRPPISHIEVPELISRADVCVVPLKVELTGAVPSKLYEVMASGKPVLLIAEGEAADIVRNYGCGLVAKPGDISEVTSAAKLLIGNPAMRMEMGKAGRKAALEHFDRHSIAQSFIEALIDKINGEGSRVAGR